MNRGEIYGILGPNGSGKTTLCKMIMMAEKMDSGDILIDNQSIRKDQNKIKSKIGICMQNDTGLFETLSVQDNINFYKAIATK